MGRIKSTFIKSIGNDLIEANEEKYKTDFNKNKKAVDEAIQISSKEVRNKIAGHITHELNKLKKLKTRKVSYDPILDRKKRRGRRR